MAAYEYRNLNVSCFDKHDNYKTRRGGDKPDRYLRVRDSASKDSLFFNDERGDDYWNFIGRAHEAFIVYLNSLGAEGWEIISYNVRANSGGSSDDAPLGYYLLMRRIEG